MCIDCVLASLRIAQADHGRWTPPRGGSVTLSYSSDGECAANLQEMLEMSIVILWGLAVERALLHQIDESWFEFETTISDVRLWSEPTLLLDGAEKSLMHFRPAICAGSCGGGDPWNLSTISQTCDPEDPSEENLDRDFLIRDSGSE
jgi:hypothetical protein